MKFFIRLFLCAAAIVTLALTAMTCITLSASLKSSYERELESALSQHQLLEYAIECSILNVAGSGTLTDENLSELAEQSASLLSDTDSYALLTDDGKQLAGDAMADSCFQVEDDKTLTSRVIPLDNGCYQLVVGSCFTQSGARLTLFTIQDITFTFWGSQKLVRQERWIFLVVMALSCLVMLVVTWLLTRPVQTLKEATAAFSAGDYTSRAVVRSGDEFQELAGAYNAMAETIEQKIADLEAAARQREDFVANFAHELKTPMTSIIGYADTIYQKELTAEELHAAAGYIVNEGMRLEALSFKLLELIGLERQEFLLEETELLPFFEDVRETILPLAQKRGVAFSMDCEEGWAWLELDLFKTLLLNLLDNALKSGGDYVTLTGRCTGEGYEIRVTDNGRGIPVQEISRITEAFYMVDKSRSRKEHGAGLGLALCDRIAKLHGTRLHYESQPGQGTTVTLCLGKGGQA